MSKDTRAKEISRFVDELVRRFHPSKVMLFGSYARGMRRHSSDVDILVVFPRVRNGLRMAGDILAEISPRFPVDIVVRSSEDIQSRIADNDFFLKEISEQGVVLYEATRS